MTLWKFVKQDLLKIKEKSTGQDEIQDPLPNKLKMIVVSLIERETINEFLISILKHRNKDFNQIFFSVC